jgi:hypothetical protein
LFGKVYSVFRICNNNFLLRRPLTENIYARKNNATFRKNQGCLLTLFQTISNFRTIQKRPNKSWTSFKKYLLLIYKIYLNGTTPVWAKVKKKQKNKYFVNRLMYLYMERFYDEKRKYKTLKIFVTRPWFHKQKQSLWLLKIDRKRFMTPVNI